MKKQKVTTKRELKEIIKNSPIDADLNYLDVSAITDMSNLFVDTEFNGDISRWDVSNVTDMSYAFYNSKFNGNISEWDVSNVENMIGMFEDSKFNRDISKWDISKVSVMSIMFKNSEFNQDISRWRTNVCTNTYKMFEGCKGNIQIIKKFINTNKPITNISKSSQTLKNAEAHDIEIVSEIINDCRLLVIRPSFSRDLKWNFIYEGQTISAKMEDENMLNAINNGKQFAKGDYIMADIEVSKFYNPEYGTHLITPDSYKILKCK